jgi:2-hydroxychromene-2-carboxylate isomerase
MRDVQFHFDFVSPYSWLALMQAGGFAQEHEIRWDMRPVVYAKILDATGLVGPVEIPSKRHYTVNDIVRCARRLGLRIQGPPAHPFRSLEALRTVCLFRSEPAASELSVSLADAAWGKGRDLMDIGVLEEIVGQVGLDGRDLAGRISQPAVKQALRDLTSEAVEHGVFGVPTFIYEDELFWGQDRLPHLSDRLSGLLPRAGDTAEKILGRPRGADRRGRPPLPRNP